MSRFVAYTEDTWRIKRIEAFKQQNVRSSIVYKPKAFSPCCLATALNLKVTGHLVVPDTPSNAGIFPSSAGKMSKFCKIVVKARKSSFLARFSPIHTRLPADEEETRQTEI